MHILLTNDDGIFAPGLAAMYDQLVAMGDVTVVAPAEVRSGASHSISLVPVTCEKVDIAGKFQGYCVDGSPVDCVKFAVKKLFEDRPIDLVISGINHGANVGVHLYYSGTVAAAMEGAFNGIPAVALSAMHNGETGDMDRAAKCSFEIIQKLLPLDEACVFNVNIPLLDEGDAKGVKVVAHSMNGFYEEYVSSKDESGQVTYLYTSGKPNDDRDTTMDTTALMDGFITVTPLRLNMNDTAQREHLDKIQW